MDRPSYPAHAPLKANRVGNACKPGEKTVKILIRSFLAVLVISLGVLLSATGPGASSGRFLLLNDNDFQGNNYGTALKLAGNSADPSLEAKNTFSTGGVSKSSSYWPNIQIIQHGSDVCVFISDARSMDIASFLYPSFAKVGNYKDDAVTSSRLGIVLAAYGNYLFAAYDGQFKDEPTTVDGQIGVWRITQGCALSLVNTYTALYPVFGMAIAPNGKALVISYQTDFYIGSYGIGPGGTLTGPYTVGFDNCANFSDGLDITADSKYAIVNVVCDYTAVYIFPINPDGSLGDNYYQFGGYGSLGNTPGGGWIRLSPDERFLFVTSGENLITLNFTEFPIHVSYGCTTTLKIPAGEPSFDSGPIAAAFTSGTGKALYVPEFFDFSSIGLVSVDSSTGCTTEYGNSPYVLTDPTASAWFAVAWPPRPF